MFALAEATTSLQGGGKAGKVHSRMQREGCWAGPTIRVSECACECEHECVGTCVAMANATLASSGVNRHWSWERPREPAQLQSRGRLLPSVGLAFPLPPCSPWLLAAATEPRFTGLGSQTPPLDTVVTELLWRRCSLRQHKGFLRCGRNTTSPDNTSSVNRSPLPSTQRH